MTDQNVLLSRLHHRQRLAEAKLTAQRKLARAAATERRIRREAEAAAQRAKALSLRQAGATLAAIGAALGGLSVTRAGEIVHKAERLTKRPHWSDALPMRAVNFLYRADLLNLPETDAMAAVAKFSQRDLLAHPNLGRGAVDEIAAWLARHGHTFSEDAAERRKRSNSPPYALSHEHTTT